jgi:hypothetical protein
MPDAPRNENPEHNRERNLNIKLEGRLTLERHSHRVAGEEEDERPYEQPDQLHWYRRVGHWFGKVASDPNACITAFATLAIAFLTVSLLRVAQSQNRLEKAVERPWISADYSIGSPFVFKTRQR